MLTSDVRAFLQFRFVTTRWWRREEAVDDPGIVGVDHRNDDFQISSSCFEGYCMLLFHFCLQLWLRPDQEPTRVVSPSRLAQVTSDPQTTCSSNALMPVVLTIW